MAIGVMLLGLEVCWLWWSGASAMSVETGLAEGTVHYGRIVETHWVDER